MDISWKPILCHPIHTVPLGRCQYWYYVGGVNVTEVPMRGLRRVVGGGRWCSVQNVWHKRSCLPLSIVALGTWMRSSPGWSLTWRGNLKKKTSIGFFPMWNIPTFPKIPSENMLKGMLPGGNWLFSSQATTGKLDKTTVQSSSHYCLQ